MALYSNTFILCVDRDLHQRVENGNHMINLPLFSLILKFII